MGMCRCRVHALGGGGGGGGRPHACAMENSGRRGVLARRGRSPVMAQRVPPTAMGCALRHPHIASDGKSWTCRTKLTARAAAGMVVGVVRMRAASRRASVKHISCGESTRRSRSLTVHTHCFFLLRKSACVPLPFLAVAGGTSHMLPPGLAAVCVLTLVVACIAARALVGERREEAELLLPCPPPSLAPISAPVPHARHRNLACAQTNKQKLAQSGPPPSAWPASTPGPPSCPCSSLGPAPALRKLRRRTSGGGRPSRARCAG